MAEEANTAPPLTVDNVLTAVQGVQWRSLGEALLHYQVTLSGRSYPKLDELALSLQLLSDDDRLRTVIKLWVQGDGIDKEPSWRHLIWRLDHGEMTGIADHIRHFAEPVQDLNLSVENVTEVMGEVGDWKRVGGSWPGLGVPVSKLQELKQQTSSEREKSQSLGEYWVNTHPDASWEKLSIALYYEEEERALAKARQFLPKADPTLTTDILLDLVKEVEHLWEKLCYELAMPASKWLEIESNYRDDHWRMEAVFDHYVRCHPAASWKHIAVTLRGMELHKQADEVTAKYVKGLAEPCQVEHYSDLEFMEKVGAGGYGTVSKGRWIPLDKIVAIKTMIVFDEREVQILNSLDHPSIIKYYGTVEEKNLHFLVTEFAENGSVYDYIHVEQKQPSLAQRLLWAKEVVEGMIHLHHQDIIHRDLKSSNVLLTSELKAKICDLGSARRLEQTVKQTTIIGTYAWMSPEMIKRDPVSKSCDVYSYGIFLWELITQQQPFSDFSGGLFLLMSEIVDGKRPPIPETCEWYLEELLNRCWQMEAKARPSFEEILLILNKDTPPSDATSQQTSVMPSPSAVTITDMKPRMAQLMRLKSAEGDKVEIIKTIAPDWKQFGLLLDLDPQAQEVRRIEAEHAQKGSIICCQEMFMVWLDSPNATWGDLIELLNDSEQKELAEQVKHAIGL